MPTITSITEQKRNPNRRSVYLDGVFTFGCKLNVIARFRLREGMQLSQAQIEQIQAGEVRQECFDAAIRFLEKRLHSRRELKTKLARKKDWGVSLIDQVLDDLQRLDYVNEARFAKTKAASAAKYKHHGRRRAFMELLRSGVSPPVANAALDEIYVTGQDEQQIRLLLNKQVPRLKRLDPLVARRRAISMLQRRGFDYETSLPIVDDVLGQIAPD